MTQKKETPVKALNGASNAQAKTSTQNTASQAKNPTVEQLQKELAEAKARLSRIPEGLEKRQEYFRMKNDLLTKFNQLHMTEENLQKHLSELAEVCTKDEFENEEYFVAIQYKEGYSSSKDLMRIKNPVLVGEMINYMIAKVKARKATLKAQIEA